MAFKFALRTVTVLIVLCLAVLGVLLYRMAELPRGADVAVATGDTGAGTAIGKFTALTTKLPAPALSFTTTSGQTVHLADYRGRVVLVNLWATWCAPCIQEMPSLARLQAKRADLAILAISEDRRGAEVVEPFLAKLRLGGLATFLDPRDAATSAFHIEGLPTSFLIDRDGRILGTLEGGAEWDAPALVAVIDRYLSPPTKAAANAG